MLLSDAGLHLIARFEGFVPHVYHDVGGLATIGYGHLLRAGESYPNGISQADALELLRSDAQVAVNAVNAGVKVAISQNSFDAIVSFTFNLGTGALASSTALRLLNTGDLQGAADALLLWDKVNGVPNQGILNRREAERELFLRPDDPDAA